MKTINKILEELAKTDMFNGEFSWGSCQYETAAATYAAFQKVKDLTSFGEALVLMGCSFAFTKKRTIEEIIALAKEDLEEQIKENPNDDFYKEMLEIFIEDDPKTMDDLLNTYKHQAWDLWSAAPFILGLAFEGDGLKIHEAPELMTAGPILNLMSQGENYETGIICAILDYHYNASDFEGYDT